MFITLACDVGVTAVLCNPAVKVELGESQIVCDLKLATLTCVAPDEQHFVVRVAVCNNKASIYLDYFESLTEENNSL